MKDADELPPRFATWIERFAADIPSADHPDYLEGVIDGIRLAANVPEVVRWFEQLHAEGRALDSSGDFPALQKPTQHGKRGS